MTDLLALSARYIDEGGADGPNSTESDVGRAVARSPTASRWSRRSPTSSRCAPTTASCCSTRAASCSPAAVVTAAAARGRPTRSTRSSTRTATSTTSAARRRSWPTPTARGQRRPTVVGHENVPPRFDRYDLTNGYNAVINQRQFRHAGAVLAERLGADPDDACSRPSCDARRRRARLRAAPRPGRDRRPHVGLDARAQGDLRRRLPHLGASRTPATRRRCSATRSSGRAALRADGGARPELLLPGARPADRRRASASAMCSTTWPTALESLVDADAGADERGRPARRDHPRRCAVPAELLERPYLQPDLRRARVRRAQHLAPVRRLVRRQPGPSSPRRTPRWPPRWPRWPAAPTVWRRGPPSWPTRRPPPGLPPRRAGRPRRARRRERCTARVTTSTTGAGAASCR